MSFVVWTDEELSVVRQGIRLGWSVEEMAEHLPGRTIRAIQCRVSLLSPVKAAGEDAIERIRSASAVLRERTLDAVQRFANTNGINGKDAEKLLLGAEPISRPPGSEVIYKTSSIRRFNTANRDLRVA